MSQNFAESLRLVPGAEPHAVMSRDLGKAKVFADRYRLKKHFSSVDALLSDGDVDVVYIASPSSLHASHAISAISAGKAVLVEKPFATDPKSAVKVINAARARNTFCMEGMWMRFIPAITALKNAVAKGEIGDPKYFYASLGFPVEYSETNRFFSSALGGGSLLDLGVYPLSLACFLFGSPSDVVGRVTLAATGVDEQASVILTFDGLLANISCGFNNTMENGAFIVGTHGTIRVEPPLYGPTKLSISKSVPKVDTRQSSNRWREWIVSKPTLVDWRRRILPTARRLLRSPRDAVYNYQSFGYQFEAMEVERCIAAGLAESPIMPLDESLNIIEMVDSIRRSG